jgi:hypothetical protein
LEHVNATPLLPSGKCEVSRMIDDKVRGEVIEPIKLLAA